MLTSLAICAVALSSYRAQYPLPNLTVPSGWGVNIHFFDPKPGEMEQLAKGGSRWVRMDLMWHQLETVKGRYDFDPVDRLFASCKKNGVRPYIILDYGNDLYQKGSPRTPESRKAFCDMVAALMRHCKGQGAIWEMWNEPNIFFWQPKPNVDEYIALAKEVGKTIRKVAPDEWYIGPATSGYDWPFLEKCFQSGLLQSWDAVSVHPYRNNEPESATTEWIRLRGLIDRYKPAGKTIPMISGEWGYSELYPGLNLDLQSKYITRQYLTNLMNGVGLSIWYDWKDDGTDPKEPEHHFGSSYSDLKPKPTYLNKQALAEALNGMTYQMRLAQPKSSDYVLAFRKGGQVKLVVWTTEKASTIELPNKKSVQATGAPQVVDLDGPAAKAISLWKPLPVGIPVGSERDADAANALLRSGVPKGGSVTFPRISDSFVDRSYPVDVVLRVGQVRLVQRTMVVPSRPVQVQLAPSQDGSLSVIVRNSGGRNLNETLSLVTGGKRVSRQLVMTAGQKEQTIRLGMVSAGTPLSLSLGKTKVLEGVEFATLPAFTGGSTLAAPYQLVDEGDPKLKGQYEVDANQTLTVKYTFPVGWKFVMVQATGDAAKPLAGKPISLGLWVRSDGFGDQLRMRYTDATGQTFQPDAGPLDWKGWRYVTFPLDGSGGRWGGANDGKVHYPIHMDTIALVDSQGGRGGSATFAIRDVSVIGQSGRTN